MIMWNEKKWVNLASHWMAQLLYLTIAKLGWFFFLAASE